jgi:hypothetical protein
MVVMQEFSHTQVKATRNLPLLKKHTGLVLGKAGHGRAWQGMAGIARSFPFTSASIRTCSRPFLLSVFSRRMERRDYGKGVLSTSLCIKANEQRLAM